MNRDRMHETNVLGLITPAPDGRCVTLTDGAHNAGSRRWVLHLKDGREFTLYADGVSIDAGGLVFHSMRSGYSVAVMGVAEGEWASFAAISAIDGSPVALESVMWSLDAVQPLA